MGLTKDRKGLVLGSIMILLGIVLLIGASVGPSFEWMLFAGAIILIILGVLMAAKQLPGGLIMGIISILLGTLVVIPNNLISDDLEPMFKILDLLVGVLLIVFGVLKLVGK